ncbi:MAG: CRISPR-associated endonuclease Cas1 [Candidatus Sulfotelmatobacter sp.]
MAATKTVPQLLKFDNSLTPRHGVVTLFGYGIQVRVDHGHLVLADGIGPDRHQVRLPRVGHGLRRLVVTGSDGMVSLSALRWLADQDAAFVMLERDGKVLATTGPVRSSDARLRRAQALAHHSGAALRITRQLIMQKLAGQERVARNTLLDDATADKIARFRNEIPTADGFATVRLIEAQAASAYWSVWRTLPIGFPKNDLARVPEHWLSFGTRISPLTGSPRLAANPANAILNYLYAVLESESRLAAAALGLDPGLGVLHVDTPNRDSLACDLMEPVRPQIDEYVLDWITRQLQPGEGPLRHSRSGRRKLYGIRSANPLAEYRDCRRALHNNVEARAEERNTLSPLRTHHALRAFVLVVELQRVEGVIA